MLSALIVLAAATSPGLDVRVDPRVELLTIVFRLAGSGEFHMESGESPYSKRVDAYFENFKNHPAVRHAAEISDTYGVGFNAVPVLAVHLKDVHSFKELVPFDPKPARWDDRWTAAVARSFVKDLKQFAKDTHFDAFLKREQPYYAKATLGLKKLAVQYPVDQWMTSFYGVPPDRKPYAIVGLLCGGGNYGMSVQFPDGKVLVTPILGADAFDSAGVPVFNESHVPLLIHEFSHAYVNHLVEPHVSRLTPSVARYEPVLKDVWASRAYSGARSVLFETFVRSAELYLTQKYLSKQAADANVREQRSSGFLWTSDLSDLLASYEGNRTQFKTFREFLPTLMDRFEQLAQDPAALYDRCPKVSVFDAQFGPVEGETRTLTLHVAFDQPMMTNSRGFSMEPPGWEVVTKTAFASDGRSFDLVLRVKANVAYTVSLNRFGSGLTSERLYPLMPYRRELGAGR